MKKRLHLLLKLNINFHWLQSRTEILESFIVADNEDKIWININYEELD